MRTTAQDNLESIPDRSMGRSILYVSNILNLPPPVFSFDSKLEELVRFLQVMYPKLCQQWQVIWMMAAGDAGLDCRAGALRFPQLLRRAGRWVLGKSMLGSPSRTPGGAQDSSSPTRAVENPTPRPCPAPAHSLSPFPQARSRQAWAWACLLLPSGE